MKTLEQVKSEVRTDFQSLNIPHSLWSELKMWLNHNPEFINFQIGTFGDFGLCIFVNQGYRIIIPVKDEAWMLAV